MKSLLIITIFIFSSIAYGQTHREEVEKFQKELNEFYKDKEKSPLTKKDRRRFRKHPFFPISDTFRIVAKLERVENSDTIEMKTTTKRLPKYQLYGIAHFTINDSSCTLNIYQSISLRETEEYKDYLFLPFQDQTNGKETYGGGRYLDLTIPKGDEIVIDFNQAYHPYCAYNYRYSCPIPPKENKLNIRIEAGVKLKK